MGIGTSLGAFYDDDHHYNSVLWDPKKYSGDEQMVVTPNESNTNKELDKAEVDPTTGLGIEVAYKHNPNHWFYDSNYNTKLSPVLEEKYKQTFKPEDSQDYDMRGWYLEQYMNNPMASPTANAEGAHYPDTYKKPNHPTFSMDSRYNGVKDQYGGVWGEEDGVDTFKPSSTNLKNLGKEGLQDYFKRVEPKAKLLLEGPNIEDRRDDTFLETYQEILSGHANDGRYSADGNKQLESRDFDYTELEKQAGMYDIDKLSNKQFIDKVLMFNDVIERLNKMKNLSKKK